MTEDRLNEFLTTQILILNASFKSNAKNLPYEQFQEAVKYWNKLNKEANNFNKHLEDNMTEEEMTDEHIITFTAITVRVIHYTFTQYCKKFIN